MPRNIFDRPEFKAWLDRAASEERARLADQRRRDVIKPPLSMAFSNAFRCEHSLGAREFGVGRYNAKGGF